MAESNIPINKLPDGDPAIDQLNIQVAVRQSLAIDQTQLVAAVRAVLVDHQVYRGAISLAVVDDPTIQALNRQYLQHDYPTDVLSFPLVDDPSHQRIEGEIVVSSDTALRAAEQLGTSLQAELLLYTIHAALHLVGYNDKIAADQREMRVAEQRYMGRFGFPHQINGLPPIDPPTQPAEEKP